MADIPLNMYQKVIENDLKRINACNTSRGGHLNDAVFHKVFVNIQTLQYKRSIMKKILYMSVLSTFTFETTQWRARHKYHTIFGNFSIGALLFLCMSSCVPKRYSPESSRFVCIINLLFTQIHLRNNVGKLFFRRVYGVLIAGHFFTINYLTRNTMP